MRVGTLIICPELPQFSHDFGTERSAHFCASSIHLPTSLCSTPVTALRCSYGGSDSRPPFTHAEGYPRFTSPECVLSFCVQPPCVLPGPLSVHSFVLAFWGRYRRAVSRLRPPVPSASPFIRRLAKTQSRIDFLSYGPTDSPSVALHPAFRRRSYGRLSTSRVFG